MDFKIKPNCQDFTLGLGQSIFIYKCNVLKYLSYLFILDLPSYYCESNGHFSSSPLKDL